MLFQLHWQNSADPEETQFVSQGESTEMEARGIDPNDWIIQQIAEKKHTCPLRWQAVILWDNHPNMVKCPV